jgi:2-polyprenyl-6-methoxyphenol hydroxylase-like FAD-dependent oxidoreductase
MGRIKSVLVIGAGIGGLAAAAALASRGIKVTVVEKRPGNQVLGVGINQPANSLRVLRDLGVLDEILSNGYLIDRTSFLDHNGAVVADIPSSLGGDVPANCALRRSALADALYNAAVAAGAVIAHGVEVTEIEDEGASVAIAGQGAEFGRFDVAIAFDGMNSRIREHLFGGEKMPVYTGYYVWRVTLPRDPSVTNVQVFHGARSYAGVIPLSEKNMYMFVVTREQPGARYTAADFRKVLTAQLAEFTGLIGKLRDDLPADADIVCSPQYEFLLEPVWHKGRVIIAGDAAHLSAPTLTQGAAMALEDAALLAEMLDSDVPLPTVFEQYAARRSPRVKLVQQVSGTILRWPELVDKLGYDAAIEVLSHAGERVTGVEKVLNQAY